VGRFWSLLFLLVPVLGVGIFFWAAGNGHWLPADASADGRQIDHLYYFILYLTGLVFVGTELVLFWFMWRYDGQRNAQRPVYTHGKHDLEVVWTILPAATLLFIAIYQIPAWSAHKMDKPPLPPTARVIARQFEWRIVYPGPDGVLGTRDDLHTVNDLRIPVDEQILIELESMDVLHSFFLPHMRVKQDAIPGSMVPVWFRAVREEGAPAVGPYHREYDLACAELCGWGHYKMKGRLTVLSRPEFDAYLAELQAQQEATQ
jgi:cytochrome c oxidase subunit 2